MSQSAERVPPPVSLRRAIGGHRGFGLEGWLLTLLPGVLVVAVEEEATAAFSLPHLLVSWAAQVTVAGAVGLPLARKLKRSGLVLPVWLALVVWAMLGAVRGAVEGVVDVASGRPAHFAEPIALWVLVAVSWMPLVTAVLTQLAYRRELLTLQKLEQHEHRSLRRRAAQTEEHLRDSLLAALDAAVTPAVLGMKSRVTQGLRSAGALEAVAQRLALTAEEVSRTIGVLSTARGPQRATRVAPAAPWAEALAFERTRPVLWAVSTGGLVLLILIPLTLAARDFSLAAAASCGVITATVAMLAFRASWQRRRRPTGPFGLIDLLRHGCTAATAPLVTAALLGGRMDPFAAHVVAALPVAMAFGAAMVSIAVGTAVANPSLRSAILDLQEDSAFLRKVAEEEEDRARDQLHALTHGPIRGRLAACTMALNFLASEGGDATAERSQFIASSVLTHLEAVSEELAALVDPRAGQLARA